jgi:hypothetical protein
VMDVDIPCRCPKSHDKDTVTFKEKLGFIEATAITNATQLIGPADPDIRDGLILAIISKYCILYGVESWTLTGEDGRPLPVDPANVSARLLDDTEVSAFLVDPAVDLYQGQVVNPLRVRVANNSQRSRMVGSTSRTPRSSRTRKQSKQSSISTIQTGDTETTSSSLDGDSSFSQNSVSAA